MLVRIGLFNFHLIIFVAKVIYTSEILPYQELDKKNRSCLYNKAYRISFMSQREYNALQRLLEHPCSK